MHTAIRSFLGIALLAGSVASADEGMWTFNAFPTEAVKKKYGFEITPEWLEHVRLSTARLGGGCTASFVSTQGLLMTNHHCARRCIEDLSTAKKDHIRDGFSAKTQAEERVCPGVEVSRLESITEVTGRILEATQGLEGQKFTEAFKAESARIEKACATSDQVRCEVVTLYHGGRYDLYQYRRYQDVRLVFAPEHAIASFGGDPDNFTYPRYDLDVTFLRAYDQGKPAKVEHAFAWSAEGAKDGDLSFVPGNPGRTSRLLTVAQLEELRDRRLLERRVYLSELRGVLSEFQNRGPEQKRISSARLFGIENSLKAMAGQHAALLDKAFFGRKVAAEKALRDAVAKDPQKQKQFGGAWDAIAKAQAQLAVIGRDLQYLEQGWGLTSSSFGHARLLVRAADELAKPNEQRLREFTDASLPALKQSLFSPAPIYPELEVATLAFSLTKLRAELGVDHPAVQRILGKRSPEEVAATAVKGTRLRDPKVREQLFSGGAAAIAASKDPMILLARAADPDARAVRKTYEDEVDSVLRRNGELVAKAYFSVHGQSTYPDATGTLRLSFGQVKGYTDARGRDIPPLTTFGGVFERHTGAEPFALPKTWLKAKPKLELSTPMNLVSTHDIIGGNSGSPLINSKGEVIGLIFDGNIESLSGDFGYLGDTNRAVSVHSAGILHALDHVYGAKRLLEELRPASGVTSGGR